MSRKQRRDTPEWQWEQALIDAYAAHRWHLVVDPLDDTIQRWKAGEIDHWHVNDAIHETLRPRRDLYSLFTEKRDYLVRLIQLDREWFDEWLADHPPPPGIELALRFPQPFEEETDQTEQTES